VIRASKWKDESTNLADRKKRNLEKKWEAIRASKGKDESTNFADREKRMLNNWQLNMKELNCIGPRSPQHNKSASLWSHLFPFTKLNFDGTSKWNLGLARAESSLRNFEEQINHNLLHAILSQIVRQNL